MNTILIRADANTTIGIGHIMRCLALAQDWQAKGGGVFFASTDITSHLEIRLQREGMNLFHLNVKRGSREDISQTIHLAKKIQANWVLLDGYCFGTEHQKAIKQAGLQLICMDDYGQAKHYVADLVLNQNISADASLYKSRETQTRLLLGTEFILLRKEFWPWKNWQRPICADANKILVTMGGSDANNATQKVIDALTKLKDTNLAIKIVIGPENRHVSALEKAIQNTPCAVCLKMNINNMPELMTWADIAISASGSTVWELAFMGLPSIIFSIASNQDDIAIRLGQIGAAVSIPANQLDRTLPDVLKELISNGIHRQKISHRAQKLVDGLGTSRVISAMVYAQEKNKPENPNYRYAI